MDAPAGACGANAYYSASGLSISQLKAGEANAIWVNQKSVGAVELAPAVPPCLTCEHESDPSRKYDCLRTQFNQLNTLPVDRVALEQKLVHHMKLLLETKADALTVSQRADAIALYTSKPTLTSQCGSAWVPPSTSSSCSVPAELIGTMTMCNQMRASHVPPTAVPAVFDACFRRTAELISQLPTTSCTAQDVSKYRTAYMDLTTELLLRDVQYVTTPLGNTSAQDAARSAELRAKLKNIQLWYSSARGYLYPAPTPDDELLLRLNAVFKRFWNVAFLQGESQRTVASDAEAEAARLGVLDNGLRAERQVLQAAFSVSSFSDAPMRGAPLLMLMGDALRGVQQRLDDVSPLHDMSCRFQDCASVRSQTRQLWGLLGSLHDATALGNELAAISQQQSDKRLDADWVQVFTSIWQRHDVLEAAVNDTLSLGSYSSTALLTRSAEALPVTAAAFTSLLKEARARVAGYTANSLFVLSDARRLEVGLDAQKQANINTRLETSISALNQNINDYKAQRQTLVQGMIAALNNQQSLSNINTRTEVLYEHLIQLSKDLDGLRASHAVDEVRHGNFMKSFEALNAGVAAEGRDVIKTERALTISAQQATYVGTGGVSNLAPIVVPGSDGQAFKLDARQGDTINLQVSGQWSPTCALSKTVGFNGTTVKPVSPNLNPIMTGPEGFAVITSDGNYYADKVETVTSDGKFRNSTTNRTACAGLSLGTSVPGGFLGISGSASACTSYSTGTTWSQTTNDASSSGSETRSTLTLARGLRAAQTPFPDQPAGSLLLVRTAHQATSTPTNIPLSDVLSVVVVRAPSTTVLVDSLSDVYLVVNDLGSCGVANPSALTVHVSHLQPASQATQTIFRAMVAAEQGVREMAKTYVAQGRLLPSQATLLRASAYDQVYQQCVRDSCSSTSGCACNNLSAYPESLRNLFETWLLKDIVDIEREVELVNIERQLRAMQLELKSLDSDFVRAQDQSRLLALEPAWALRNLDGAELRGSLHDLSYVVTQLIEPVITLRHPEVRTHFTTDDKALLNALIYFDPLRRDLISLAGQASSMARMVNTRLSAERSLGPTQTINEVIISIPRVDKGGVSDFNTVDDETAVNVWNQILAGKDPLITLKPDHAYLLGGGQKVLGCTQAAPIINTMALYLVHDSLTAYLPFSITTTFSPKMTFPTTPMLHQYDFVREDYLAPTTQLLLGWNENVMNDLHQYWALPGTQVATGLSPFGTMHLDLTSFRRKYPNNPDGTLSSDNPLFFANELLIAFRVEPRQEAPTAKLPGVPECD